MSTIKRFGILLLLINPLLAFLMLYSYFTWYFFSEYPMAKVIAPTYDSSILLILFIACCLNVPLLIWAYITKNNKFNKIIILFSTLIIGLSILFVVNILGNYAKVKRYYNPETVQSTMIEVNLQQLEDLQKNKETTMIYFGRPSCPDCNKIKPNLDILVNNSHSMVYYYNTEQDRDDNHDEMQTVLDTYGVGTVPALVVWADAGEIQEIYFNEDIVDYFLDTSRFSY